MNIPIDRPFVTAITLIFIVIVWGGMELLFSLPDEYKPDDKFHEYEDEDFYE